MRDVRRRTLLATALAAGAVAAGQTPATRHHPDPAHTDVLFVGAHPDDEAQNLSTFGQWRELHGLSIAVLTVTRGEGGGNATGTEEGAALGLRVEEEIRQLAIAVAADMDEDARTAIEKLARYLQPDATPGTGHHDIAIFE